MRSEILIPGTARIEIFENQRGEITIKKLALPDDGSSPIPQIISLTAAEVRQIVGHLEEVADYCDSQHAEEDSHAG